jgi:transglycosylase-like protein with SLT domain
MRSSKVLVIAVMVILTLLMDFGLANAQNASAYQQMSAAEQQTFVREQARRIALEISGREYQFTPEFLAVIKKSVDGYARRVGNNVPERIERSDLRSVFERGRTYAPALNATFTARNLSPLIGIYLPMIESEYLNLQTANELGALGMFQFLPATGRRYGLSKEELLDVNKSADAAAQYISHGIVKFNGDSMKEALAILAYNRGGRQVAEDLAAIVTNEKETCSICALTAASSRMDRTFQEENINYVPRFFAAAIIGENPSSFGLVVQPLSTYR